MADREEHDDDGGRPLTPDERRAIRRLLEADARATWLWASIRVWLAWISAAIISAAAIQQAVSAWLGTFKFK